MPTIDLFNNLAFRIWFKPRHSTNDLSKPSTLPADVHKLTNPSSHVNHRIAPCMLTQSAFLLPLTSYHESYCSHYRIVHLKFTQKVLNKLTMSPQSKTAINQATHKLSTILYVNRQVKPKKAHFLAGMHIS